MEHRGWTVVARALGAWSLALGIALAQSPPAPRAAEKLAESRLMAGQAILAVDIATQCLAADPGDVGCRRVLARANGQVGRCGEALADLSRLRGASVWDGRLAMTEVLCRIRTSDFAGAEAALDEADAFGGVSGTSRFERGLLALRLGDVRTAEAQVASLGDDPDDLLLAELLEAWIAVEEGAPDADARLGLLISRKDELGSLALTQLRLLECRRWLALDDPREAAEIPALGVSLAGANPRIAACRAEAYRRGADPFEALAITQRPWLKLSATPALDAVTVRALVDAGRVEEARPVAARLNRWEADSLAARWYFARATNDEAAAGAAAAAFERVKLSGSLREQLPWGQR